MIAPSLSVSGRGGSSRIDQHQAPAAAGIAPGLGEDAGAVLFLLPS